STPPGPCATRRTARARAPRGAAREKPKAPVWLRSVCVRASWIPSAGRPWSSAAIALHAVRALAVDVGRFTPHFHRVLRELATVRLQRQQHAVAHRLHGPAPGVRGAAGTVAGGAGAAVGRHAGAGVVRVRAVAAEVRSE